MTSVGFYFKGNADISIPRGPSDPQVLRDRASYTGILAIARLEPHVTVAAGVSIGNIYNDHKGKEELYLSVIRCHKLHVEKQRKKSLGSL